MSRFPMKVEFPGLGWEFDINNVCVSIFGFKIYWYAVLILTGLVLAVVFAFKNCKRFNIKPDPFLDVIIVGFICSIVGARLYYVIFYENKYESFFDVINIRDGGLAIYGAVIGAFLGAFFTSKKKGVAPLAVFDIAGIGFLIGQAFGRWGNFANQEAFGTPTDLPWGMMSVNTGNVPVHPCFLYESLWCAIGFAGLYYLSTKLYKFQGQYFLLYLLWYGLGRFWIEGLRTDSLWLIPNVIRVSQLIAGLCVLVTIPLLVLGFKGKLFARVPDGGWQEADETTEQEAI